MRTILAIETSCDETAIAVVQSTGDRHEVLSNALSSQVKIHKKYGGVVPMLAAREHARNLPIVLSRVLQRLSSRGSGFVAEKVDLIAVTNGPGLIPALLTGAAFAKALAWRFRKPLIGVNHLEGHIYSNFIRVNKKSKIKNQNDNSKCKNARLQTSNARLPTTDYRLPKFPALCLVVSGGHTELILVKGHQNYELLGATVDDAAGEAFDKVARLLGLGYPGGPAIEQAAMLGNRASIQLPRPMMNSGDLNFSFAGLKTAVLYALPKKMNQKARTDFAASFQQAVVDVLISKTLTAARRHQVKSMMVAGGVSANRSLQDQLRARAAVELPRAPVFFPDTALTTDNAIMIAVAAYYRTRGKSLTKFSWRNLKVDANARLC